MTKLQTNTNYRISNMKVALVHDYLIDFGGGERVLLALHELWPEAPVFTAITDPQKMGPSWKKFACWDIRTSWFQKIPGHTRLISPLRFLLPYIWESFDFSGFDVVISSSAWAISKGIITTPEQKHFCYCHTPPRFLYGYPQAREWTKYWPVRAYASLINHHLRFYDWSTSQRVDQFIANSQEVRQRIRKFYQQNAVVIHPPVDIPPYAAVGKTSKDAPYLFTSRLVSYKHPELAIEACLSLKRQLVVVGDGPMMESAHRLAHGHPNIKVVGHVSDQELGKYYQSAKAFIFPVEEEDFGIAPIEAQAYGKPVIALWSGGTKETVIEGKTGIFFKEPTVDSLKKAILKFEKEQKKFDPQVIRKWAENFSKERFKKQIKELITS